MTPDRLFEYALVLLVIAVGGIFVFAVIAANYIAGNDQWGEVAVATFFLEWGLIWVLANMGDDSVGDDS